MRKALFGPHGPGCFVHAPPTDQVGTCYVRQGNRKFGSILINELESALRRFVDALPNVTVLHREATSRTLRGALGRFDYLVGCDGKNSRTRKLLGGRPTHVATAGYGLVLVFNSPETSRSRRNAAALRRVARSAPRRVPQHRFRMFRSRQGRSFYIAVQLQKEEFALLSDERTLADAPAAIQRVAKDAAGFYGVRLPRQEAVRLMFFPISFQVSSLSTGVVDGTRVALIGDAFMSVNFFSGLGINYAFDEGAVLADAIAGQDGAWTALRRMMRHRAEARRRAVATKALGLPGALDARQRRCREARAAPEGRSAGLSLRSLSRHNQCLVMARSPPRGQPGGYG